MPPCGNFGMACMPENTPISGKNLININERCPDDRDCKDTEAGENKNIKSSSIYDPISVLPLLDILQDQAAWTEFRGGLIV